MCEREIQIKERWKPLISQPDVSLKQVAKDIYNGLIFTDRHCRPHEITMRFPVIGFMGPKQPSKPGYQSDGRTTEGNRDNAIYDIIQFDDDMKKWEDNMMWHEVEMKYYRYQYLNSIGMLYEYLTEASLRSINGGPMFMSLRILNKVDTTKVWEYYKQYKSIRELADNF